ncbi:MAG: hypothetical protein ACR2NN_26540 [Bryobacteraceae bacterium]
MRNLWLASVLLASGSPIFGQLDSNSIIVTASRTTNLQPGQLVFSVGVHSDLNASLDEIVGTLQGLGITAASLTGVYGASFSPVLTIGPVDTTAITAQPGLDWIFSLPVPFDQMKRTDAALTALQQTIVQKNNGLSLSFSVEGTRPSPGLQQPDQCPTADLVSDAQRQAGKLADAAGVTAGPIAALSDGSAPSGAGYFAFARSGPYGYSSFLLGSQTISSTSGLSQIVYPAPTLYCSITVKFQLLRYQ